MLLLAVYLHPSGLCLPPPPNVPGKGISPGTSRTSGSHMDSTLYVSPFQPISRSSAVASRAARQSTASATGAQQGIVDFHSYGKVFL